MRKGRQRWGRHLPGYLTRFLVGSCIPAATTPGLQQCPGASGILVLTAFAAKLPSNGSVAGYIPIAWKTSCIAVQVQHCY